MSTAIGPPPVTTTDEYSDPNAAVFDFNGTPYVWGYLNISGNPVLVSLLVGSDRGQTDWSIDYPVYSSFLPLSAGGARPGGRSGDAIWGVKIRALLPGQQAQVTGAFFQAGETGIVPGATGGTAACPCNSGGSLITTDGTVTVNPTAELFIGSGLILTNPAAGEAKVEIPPPELERVLGNQTTGSSASDFPLDWNHLDGDGLLDYSMSRLHPTVIADGEYSLTLPVSWIADVALSASFTWKTYLLVDQGLAGEWKPAEFSGQEVILQGGGFIREGVETLSWTGPLRAGQSLSVYVHQDHAATSQKFQLGGPDANGPWASVAKIQAGGGGGSVLPASVTAQYSGNPVTIANNTTASLTWDTLAAGTELFDRSNPASPLALADGVYSFALDVSPSGLTAGGFAQVQAVASYAAGIGGESDAVILPDQVTMTATGLTSAVLVWPMKAGDDINLIVGNFDGAVSRDFSLFQGAVAKIL